MAILDDIMLTTQKVGKAIADTATDAYDYTKASYNIASLESKLQDALAEIGRYTLRVHQGGSEDEEMLASLLAHAKALTEELEQVKCKRAEIKNQVICSACGHPNAKDSAYCSACGAKLAQ